MNKWLCDPYGLYYRDIKQHIWESKMSLTTFDEPYEHMVPICGVGNFSKIISPKDLVMATQMPKCKRCVANSSWMTTLLIK